MTREEAFNRLEQMYDFYAHAMDSDKNHPFEGDEEAIKVALLAIAQDRSAHITREQVEKVWPGCPYCKEDGEGYVKKFGAYSIQNGELATGHCKPQKIKFCPHCGRPLTDEAVDMVMERMEALKDE